MLDFSDFCILKYPLQKIILLIFNKKAALNITKYAKQKFREHL